MNPSRRRNALVTGASHGIGRAVSVALARSGMDLVLTARSEESLKETAKAVIASGGQASVIPADISTHVGRNNLINAINKETDTLSVFVHTASANTDPDNDADIRRTSDETIDSLVHTTVAGTIFLVRALIPFLERGAPSNMVLIASDWALRGSHGPSVFSAAKAAVAQLGHTLRRPLAAQHISTTVIYPGDVASFDVDWTEPKWQLDDSVDKVKAELGNTRIPLVDIVDSVIFVISRKMSRVEELWIAPLDPEYDY